MILTYILYVKVYIKNNTETVDQIKILTKTNKTHVQLLGSVYTHCFPQGAEADPQMLWRRDF